MNNQQLPAKFDIEVVEGSDIQGRFGLPRTELGPLQVIRVFDPGTDRTWGYVVIDNLVRGPSLGGIRLAPDITVDEVFVLARAMTLKNAAAMLPLGGGKSGIVGDPVYYMKNPLEKEQLITLFAEALWPVRDYIAGPDMGTDEGDMQFIYDTYTRLQGAPNHGRGGIGRPPENGGLPLDEWGLTAHGLFAAARTSEEYEPGFHIEDSTVIVQGYGNVGSHIGRKLHDAGAKIVGASDINMGLYNPDGLDVDELAEVRKGPRGLANYTGPAATRFVGEYLDDLMTMECDILVPAARPDVITGRNADRIRARLILQGANNPIDRTTEHYLERSKGIACLSDFIVNSGGVIACAVELKMDTDEEYREEVLREDGVGKAYLEKLTYETVSSNVREIYGRLAMAKGDDIIWRDAATDLAIERLSAAGFESSAQDI